MAALEVCVLFAQEGKKIIDFIMKARIEINLSISHSDRTKPRLVDLYNSIFLQSRDDHYETRWDRCCFFHTFGTFLGFPKTAQNHDSWWAFRVRQEAQSQTL